MMMMKAGGFYCVSFDELSFPMSIGLLNLNSLRELQILLTIMRGHYKCFREIFFFLPSIVAVLHGKFSWLVHLVGIYILLYGHKTCINLNLIIGNEMLFEGNPCTSSKVFELCPNERFLLEIITAIVKMSMNSDQLKLYNHSCCHLKVR
ncbi:hypothetical protein M5K25_000376 [Dendrobium thyrsiflorum]|uniref:Uncharacterized protein n=1 Tax=Dendrobium thyrsiflorum TaxID=117978 RepID=A0ABD0W7R8_DENTH